MSAFLCPSGTEGLQELPTDMRRKPMKEYEIASPQELLDEKGRLVHPGWSRSLYALYDRSKITASRLRIKDWDYYYVGDGRNVLGLTIADLGYAGLVTATVIDLEEKTEHNVTAMPLLPLGKLGVPVGDLSGDVHFTSKKLNMSFIDGKDTWVLRCHAPDFIDGKPLDVEVVLQRPPTDSMVIATPWKENPKAFYYNQKINCMPAEGTVRIGGKIVVFKPSTAFATADRGRGVWTYDNTWYWGSGNGVVDGIPVGFNIGYGFGDTSRASENIFFHGYKGHKLGRLTFDIPKESYCREDLPWTFVSEDGRLDMKMVPVYDRRALTKIGPILNDGHQVFGVFSGCVVLDDGTKLEFTDIHGFAEEIHNKY